jgi:TonB C terminal
MSRSRSPRGTIFDDPLARTASIPLVLWVCAALVAHLFGGGGAMKAAEIVHERDELRAAFRYAREGVHPPDTTFELMTDTSEPAPQAMEPPKEDGKADGKSDEPPDPNAPPADPSKIDAPKPDKPAKVEPPKPEEHKVEPPKVAEKPKEHEPPVHAVPLPAAPPPPPPPPPDVDHRQAVKQNVPKNQADNPDAKMVADEANHTDHETVARARAQDQDMPNPSMGASAGPKGEAGNSEDEHSGSAEKHAPGESSTAASDDHHENPAPPVPPTKSPAASVPGAKGSGGRSAPAAAPPPSPGGAGPAAPEVVAGDKGSYSLDPANPGGDGKSRTAGKKRQWPSFQSPVHVGELGYGGTGVPGGPQLNLDARGAQAAVGNEKLKAERAADGAARRAAHKGGWEKNKFAKWRPAIENYVANVQLDNTTALNAAAQPFATYKVTMHNRIHPIFAEEFLAFLDGLPKGHPLNDDHLVTVLEIVLDKDTGRVVDMGVTKASGMTAFDIAALNAIDRSQPFGKAPDLIASPDGRVYFHWEFHRDPVDACTTRNAFPYLLKNPPPPKKQIKPLGPTPKPGAQSPDDRTPGPLLPLRER